MNEHSSQRFPAEMLADPEVIWRAPGLNWQWSRLSGWTLEDRPLCFTVQCLPCDRWHWTVPAPECDGTSSSAMLPVDVQRTCAGVMPFFLAPFDIDETRIDSLQRWRCETVA
jgi:hypothetical protein